MIIWGGENDGYLPFADGGKYNPATDIWTTITTTNAPPLRIYNTAVWTGTEMLIWGGSTEIAQPDNDGSRYNPSTNTWMPITTTGAPVRADHSAVWTGTEMLIWGGWDSTGLFINTGAKYNPSTDTWTPITTTNAPEARRWHTAIWTGQEMLIWGGQGEPTNYSPIGNGAKYNPVSDSWTPINTTGAPLPARAYYSAVWTGSDMLIWGGADDGSISDIDPAVYFNDGFKYNLATDTWTPLPAVNLAPRAEHGGWWLGQEMLIWGGSTYGVFFKDGAIYKP